MFIDEFTQFLPGILVKYRNVITLGDFNLHLDTTDPDAAIFTDIKDAMGLTPHVTVATHVAGHTLDQMYTVLDSQVEVLQCSQGPLLSDHHVIIGHLALPKNAATICTIKGRKIKGIELEAFKNDINTEDIPLTDIDTAISALDAELLRVLDAHAQLRERKVSDRKTNLGCEDHVKWQKKFVRNRESIWYRYKCQHEHQCKAFTIEHNHFNQMLVGSKIRASSAKVKECGHDTKKHYKLINGITGRTTPNHMLPAKTDKELADKFADFSLLNQEDKGRSCRLSNILS